MMHLALLLSLLSPTPARTTGSTGHKILGGKLLPLLVLLLLPAHIILGPYGVPIE